MHSENYEKMSVEELASKFVVLDTMERDLSRRLGIIYYHLRKKLGLRVGRYKGDSIYSTLLKAGATRAMIGRASSYAKVYEDVVDEGILSFEEYGEMTLVKIMDYNRAVKPTKNSKPLFHVAPPSRQLKSPSLPVVFESLDDEVIKTPQAVNAALEAAQEWLLKARERLPDGKKRWDDLLASGLNSIGRIRYEIAEDARAHPKLKENVLQ